jgi:hypothetical protein
MGQRRITQGTKKKFIGALVFKPVPGVIWGADSEKCIGWTASALVFEILLNL